MADKTPVRVVFNASNVATGLAEFQSGETVPVSNGGTGISSIGSAGQASGTNGPGFAAIKFKSESPIQVSRTNSGRVMTRSVAGHKWDISITYNPMTRDQFEPVYSFLLQQKGRLNPFYIQLPNQYRHRLFLI